MPTYEKGSVLALTPPEDEFDPFTARGEVDAAAAITVSTTERVRCVQCDRCGKWRELADVDALPDEWFCELAQYGPEIQLLRGRGADVGRGRS